MIKTTDIKWQHEQLKFEIESAIQNVIDKTAFIGGEFVQQFEHDFAQIHDVPFCVGVGNGTDALQIALMSLGLPKGEVIVPAATFIATAEAVTHAGHTPIFVDVNEAYYTLCPDDLKKKITEKTRAIMAVHLYGHPCLMDQIQVIAAEYGLPIIEDCAQAHLATWNDKMVGTFGTHGCYSFYPGKNLGAYGDAGAIVMKNQDLYDHCQKIKNHGREGHYDHVLEGMNSRLDGLQAAVLSVKLKQLKKWTETRQKNASFYQENLNTVDQITLPKVHEKARHVYHQYVIQSDRRDALKTYLESKGIQTAVHYPLSLPQQKAYPQWHEQSESYYATSMAKRVLSLPIGEHLSHEDLNKVVEAIQDFF